MRAKIEIEQDIQHINQELDILLPLQADEKNPDGSISQEVGRLQDRLKVLEIEWEKSNQGIIFNPEEEDRLDAEIESDLEAELFADDIETTKVHFYRDGGQVYSTSSQFSVSKEEVIDLANSVTAFDRSERGADEINDIDGALSILRTKYPEYAELDSSDFYDDEEMDEKFDDYALSSYEKGGKTENQAIYEWNTMDKFTRADFLEEIEEDVNLGDDRFYMKGYKYDDLPKKVQKEVVNRLSYGFGGMLAGFVVGGYAGYKYGLTKRKRDVKDLFSEEKKFAKDYKKRMKKQKEERKKRGEREYTDYKELKKGGCVDSYANGGKLNSVRVKFKNSKYDYSTSIGANVSEAQARKYFVGMPVNVASYPREKFEEVIDIDYTKGGNYEKGGTTEYPWGTFENSIEVSGTYWDGQIYDNNDKLRRIAEFESKSFDEIRGEHRMNRNKSDKELYDEMERLREMKGELQAENLHLYDNFGGEKEYLKWKKEHKESQELPFAKGGYTLTELDKDVIKKFGIDENEYISRKIEEEKIKERQDYKVGDKVHWVQDDYKGNYKVDTSRTDEIVKVSGEKGDRVYETREIGGKGRVGRAYEGSVVKVGDKVYHARYEVYKYAKGGEVSYDDVKERVLDNYGYSVQDFHKGMMSRQEARQIMRETNELYLKLSKPKREDLGMLKYAKGGRVMSIERLAQKLERAYPDIRMRENEDSISVFEDFPTDRRGDSIADYYSESEYRVFGMANHFDNFLKRNGYWAEWVNPEHFKIYKLDNYAKGGKITGAGKSGLDKIKKTSKDNPSQMYKVTDDNYSNIGNFYLKNGKFAKMTVSNADYDFAYNKVSLRPKRDVIYKATEIEGKGGYFAKGGMLNYDYLSSNQYQKAKKLKDFKKEDYKWISDKNLYVRKDALNEDTVTGWNEIEDERDVIGMEDYAKGGEINIADLKKGDYVQKKGSNIALEVISVEKDKYSDYDVVELYDDVLDRTQRLINLSEYEMSDRYDLYTPSFAKGGKVLSEDELWDMIESYNWKNDGNYDRIRKEVNKLSTDEYKQLRGFSEAKNHQLNDKYEKEWLSDSFPWTSDDNWSDLTAEIVGRGKKFYNQMNKKKLRDMAEKQDYRENFLYVFHDHKDWDNYGSSDDLVNYEEKWFAKGGYIVGDKVKMFEDEPFLTITKVNTFSDKKNTYNLKSNDGKIDRRNISENKIEDFAKGGDIDMKEEKIKEIEELKAFLKTATDKEDIEQAKLSIEELENEIMYNYAKGGSIKANDFKVGDKIKYDFKDKSYVGKITDHFGDGVFVELNKPLRYENPKKSSNPMGYNTDLIISKFELFENEESPYGSLQGLRKYAKGGRIDYFEEYELLQKEYPKIYEVVFEQGELTDYKDTERLLHKLNSMGWTFDYGLDNSPYDLRPFSPKMNWPNYAKGGKIYQVKDMDKFDEWYDWVAVEDGEWKDDEVRYEKDGVYIRDDIYETSDSLDRDNLYAKGGALSKEFKFDKNFVIYVPSTSDVGKKISKKELDKRVDEVERFVANEFGGYTETDTDGGYKSTSGEIIEEDIVKVSVFANNKDWKDNEKKVVSKVKRWAKDWGQEAIGFEYEGDLYYIDNEGKYAKGGKLKMPTKFDEDVINIYFQLQTEYGNKVPEDLTAEQVYEMANEGYSFPQYSKKASAEALRIHKSENKYAKGGEVDAEVIMEGRIKKEIPPEQWGAGVWRWLHKKSFEYPDNPTQRDKTEYAYYYNNLPNVLPCKECRENIATNLKKFPLTDSDLNNSHTLSLWVYKMHEIVNKMLKKESGLTYNDVKNHYVNGSTYAKGGQVYRHKHIPTMTFEITGETSKGYQGIQKDKKSLSKLERIKGKKVSYSSSELKELFEKDYAKGGVIEIIQYPEGSILEVSRDEFKKLKEKDLIFIDDDWTYDYDAEKSTYTGQYGYNEDNEEEIERVLGRELYAKGGEVQKIGREMSRLSKKWNNYRKEAGSQSVMIDDMPDKVIDKMNKQFLKEVREEMKKEGYAKGGSINEDYPFDVFKKIENLKGGALLRFGNEIWVKIGNKKDQWICRKGPEKGVISDSTVLAQRVVKSNTSLKIEVEYIEDYAKGGFIKKGDYVRDARGELGLVNKVSKGVAYVKYPSTNQNAFEPVFLHEIKETKDMHKGRKVYTDFYKGSVSWLSYQIIKDK